MMGLRLVFAFLISSFILSGCATSSAKPMVGPDGSAHQLVTCGYIEGCYEKAREACGGNYKIVNSTSDTSGVSDHVSSTVSTDYQLLVKCEH